MPLPWCSLVIPMGLIAVCLFSDPTSGRSFAVGEFCQCHETGPCGDSRHGPGLLDTTADMTFSDDRPVGVEGAIWGCVDNTTSFLWYKLVNGTRVPFPTEEEAERMQCCDRNQTLIFNSLRKSDNGTYVFVASNGTAEVSGNYTLRVYCKNPDPKLIYEGEAVQHVHLGSRKSLRCAGDFGPCPYEAVGGMQWVWEDAYGKQSWIENTSNWNVVCDQHFHDCNLTVLSVTKADFAGTFVCVLETPKIGAKRNFTIHLQPPVDKTDILSIVIAGSVLGAAVVIAVMVFCVWRYYGDYIVFKCRSPPDRGECRHDTVVVHGDDHEQFVKHIVKPQLEDHGYDVLEETARLGRPEVFEKSEAIMDSYCVILSFSTSELRAGQGIFLTKIAKLKHPYDNVVVIKTQDGDHNLVTTASEDQAAEKRNQEEDSLLPTAADPQEINGLNHTSTASANRVEGQGRKLQENSSHRQTEKHQQSESVWKHEAFKSVKILTWPKCLDDTTHNTNNSSSSVALGSSRKMNKFWYSLFNHLPKPLNDREAPGRSSRNSRSSSSSQRKLLDSHNRSSSRTSDFAVSQQQGSSAESEVATSGVALHGNEKRSEDIPLRYSGSKFDTVPEDDEVFVGGSNEKVDIHHTSPPCSLLHNTGDRLSVDSEPESPHDVPLAVKEYRDTAPGMQAAPVRNPTKTPHVDFLSIPGARHQTTLRMIPEPDQHAKTQSMPQGEAENLGNGESETENHFAQVPDESQTSPISPYAGGRITRPDIFRGESGYHSLSPPKEGMSSNGGPPYFTTRSDMPNVAAKENALEV
ncbi:hypothetical protein BaRGS_00032749 [Batillaria attramentaria]|uniref:Immunoglobulin domain-containing protein n=1 Tax=Batillaria attramentaria TaxID=370345 RepID=A0ABD0JND1_9CAEN